MSTITTRDGTQIFTRIGKRTACRVFNGWPLNAEAWDAQMLFLGQRGYRVIAHDRRSHGRSQQTWDANEMDTYTDDLSALFEHLDLSNAVMIGNSTRGGEVVRYVGRHGSNESRGGAHRRGISDHGKECQESWRSPIEMFDEIRAGVVPDRSQSYKDLTMPFFGYNRPGAKTSWGVRENFWYQGMQGGIKGSMTASRRALKRTSMRTFVRLRSLHSSCTEMTIRSFLIRTLPCCFRSC